jgi:uncharacterized protein YuzE
MKPVVKYFQDTDTLSVDLTSRPAAEAEEVAEDVIIDFDGDGNVVGFTIEHASRLLGAALIGKRTAQARR